MERVHIVVVGCGRVGSGLAVDLAEQGHSVAILDKVARSFRRLPAAWPGTTVVGSGFDRDDLDRAGAATAEALAAVTSGDNSNILTARIARENYGISNVVARIYDPRRAEIYQRLGIPTVATVTWTIDQVLRRLLPQTVTGEWTDSTGQMVLVEHLLPEAWAGKRLDDLSLAGQASLVAVTRAGVPRLDVATVVGQEGDVLHVAVMKSAMNDLENRIATGTAATGPAEGRKRS
ncbi:MAG TPA: NAD-binding protein [Acidimicrobiales bacterium]|nr:NAD-binding protein [Acidimicrobiales bacterium]